MATETHTYDEIEALAFALAPAEKVRLIERLAWRLQHDIHGQFPRATRSWYGIAADPNVPSLSAEEIDQARREMWGGLREHETEPKDLAP